MSHFPCPSPCSFDWRERYGEIGKEGRKRGKRKKKRREREKESMPEIWNPEIGNVFIFEGVGGEVKFSFA